MEELLAPMVLRAPMVAPAEMVSVEAVAGLVAQVVTRPQALDRAVAALAAAGVKYGPGIVERMRGKVPAPKPPIIKIVPLTREELPRYKVSQLEAENLVEVIGGRRHEMIGEGVVESSKRRAFQLGVAKQWIDALDGKPDFAGDKLRSFAGLNAKTVVALSEVAMEFPGTRGGDLSPREAAGLLETAARLVRDCQSWNANSLARGKQFFKDPEFIRRLRGKPLELKAAQFFAKVAEADPSAIQDIYRELGF
jgi:hypothetical protein